MFQTLTFLHNITRWLVLAGIVTAIGLAIHGLLKRRRFSAADNAVRHWAATFAHIQLVLGMLLYFKSAAIRYFWRTPGSGEGFPGQQFFPLIHPICMLAAIVVLTIGSALAKRRETNTGAFRTMLIWYAAALAIMLVAVPWPFSPFASRPYWR